jgi:phage shock protein A
MGILKRLHTIFNAKANDTLDKIEEPVSMTKEAIRKLKEARDNAIKAMANVESIRLDNQKKAEAKKNEAEKWRNDAVKLNDKIENGDGEAATLEPLIITALNNQEKAMSDAKVFETNAKNLEVQVAQMNEKITKLSNDIKKSEEDLVLLESRQTTADAMLEVNKELTDSSEESAKVIMSRMEARVSKTENMAAAYGNLDTMNKTDEQKIEEALNTPSAKNDADKLASFRSSLKK